MLGICGALPCSALIAWLGLQPLVSVPGGFAHSSLCLQIPSAPALPLLWGQRDRSWGSS